MKHWIDAADAWIADDGIIIENPTSTEVSITPDDCEDCEHYLTPWKCNGGTEESPCPLSLDTANLPASDAEPASDDSNAAREYGHDDAMRDLTKLYHANKSAQNRLTAYIERLEARVDKANTLAISYLADRDYWKAMAEWLAGEAADNLSDEAGFSTTQAYWLQAAEEAIRWAATHTTSRCPR